MKKSFVYQFILFIVVSFFCIGKVNAEFSHQEIEAKTQDGSAILVCNYQSTQGTKEGIKIYYILGGAAASNWSVYYSHEGFYDNIKGPFKNYTFGDFSKVFASDGNRISYNSKKNKMDSNKSKNFTCPNYGFVDNSFGKAICLSDTNSCTGFGNFEALPLVKNDTSIFNDVKKYMETNAYATINANSVKNDSLSNILSYRVDGYLKENYKFDTYFEPPFVQDYVNNFAAHMNAENDQTFNNFKTRLSGEIDAAVSNGTMSKSEADKAKADLNKTTADSSSYGSGPIISPGIPGGSENLDDCEGMLGDLTPIVNNLLTFIQYLGPILVAVLTIVDFIKAVASGDAGDMKKAANRLMKRIVVAILLFFIPLICKTVFGIVGITVPNDCIKS